MNMLCSARNRHSFLSNQKSHIVILRPIQHKHQPIYFICLMAFNAVLRMMTELDIGTDKRSFLFVKCSYTHVTLRSSIFLVLECYIQIQFIDISTGSLCFPVFFLFLMHFFIPSIVDLQCYLNFCCTAEITQLYTYIRSFKIFSSLYNLPPGY